MYNISVTVALVSVHVQMSCPEIFACNATLVCFGLQILQEGQILDAFLIFQYTYLRIKPGTSQTAVLLPPRSANEMPNKYKTVFRNWSGVCSPSMPFSQSTSSCSKLIGSEDIVPPSLSAHLFFIRLSKVNLRRTNSWSSINFQKIPFCSK